MVSAVDIGAHEKAGINHNMLALDFVLNLFDFLQAKTSEVELTGKSPAGHVFNKKLKEGVFFEKISID